MMSARWLTGMPSCFHQEQVNLIGCLINPKEASFGNVFAKGHDVESRGSQMGLILNDPLGFGPRV